MIVSIKYIPEDMIKASLLFDSHIHLDTNQPGLEGLLHRANQNGVKYILIVGTDISSSQEAVELAKRYDRGLWAAVGCHPHEADEYASCELSALENLIQFPQVIGIGETGLDAYKMYSDLQNQQRLFLKHIEIALKYNKPLIIHCRQAHAICREILHRLDRPVRGVMHCFSGSKEDLRDYLGMGLYISIAGPVTFTRAHKVREIAKAIPLSRLLVETDSPYLAPQPVRGKPNEPAYLRYIVESLAELHGITPEQLTELTTTNAFELFKIQC
jgi:TatD DNase family protein